MARKELSKTQKALNLWAIILIVWSVYRSHFKLPEWFDEFIAKPLIFILPVYYYIKSIEKKDFFSSIDLKKGMFLSDVLMGIFAGFIFILAAILANFLKLHKIFLFQKTLSINYILWVALLALATGISEEILSRGFIVKRLYEESKNMITASFLSSILFFFLHVPILFTNLQLTGRLLMLFMGTDIVLSLMLSILFITRKSLILPIIIHAFYNMAIALFI